MPNSHHRPLTPFVGVFLWVSCVAVTTGLVTSVVWVLRHSETPATAEVDDWLWGSREAKLAAIRDAFDGHPSTPIDLQWNGLEAFFNQLKNNQDAENQTEWVELLDSNRFRHRRMASPWIKTLSFINRRFAAIRNISDFPPREPNQVTRFEFFKIVPWNSVVSALGKRNEEDDVKLVFAHAHLGYSDFEPMLFWVYQKGNEWKLVDWEFVEAGMSESELTSLYERVSHEKLGQGFYTACQHLNLADANPNDCERALRQAEACQMPEIIVDRMRYLILSRWWNQRSRGDEALRLSKLVAHPEKIPGIPLVMASALQQKGDVDEALVVLDQMESVMGFRPDSAKLRARLLQSANRREEAVDAWKRIVDFEPGDSYQLGQWYHALPRSRRSELIDWIKARPEPATIAAKFVVANAYRLPPDMQDEVLKIAKEIDSNCEESKQLELFQLTRNHQYRAAAQWHQHAAEQADDENHRQQQWREFFQNMSTLDDLSTAFSQHPDPKTAFQILFGGFDGGESIVSAKDAPPLLAAYRNLQPDDPWLTFYEGCFAANEMRFADANQKFSECHQWLSNHEGPKTKSSEKDADDGETDELEQLAEQLRVQSCRTRYELGEDVKILEEYNRDETVYQSLASRAMQSRHWSTLERLNLSFAATQPNNPWLLYYRLRVLLAAKDTKAVRDILKVASRSDNKQQLLPYLRDQIDRELTALESPDPIDAYQRSKDRTSAFGQIANQLLTNREWEKLDQLCEIHLPVQKNGEVDLIRLDEAVQQADANRVIELLSPWPKTLKVRHSYLEPYWREQFVRSLIRLNRIAEAREKALEMRQCHDEVWPLVMTYVAERNPTELTRLLKDDDVLASAWNSRQIAFDPELNAILTDDAFGGFRRELEFAFYNSSSQESLVLFLKNPRDLTENFIRDRFATDASSVDIEPISASMYVVNWQGVRFVVSSTHQPYFSSEFLDGLQSARRREVLATALESTLQGQSAFWQFVQIGDERQYRNSSKVTVREFASRLLNPDVIGVMHFNAFGYQTMMIGLNGEQSQLLSSRRPFSELDPKTIVLELPRAELHLDRTKRHLLVSLAEHHSDQERHFPNRIDIQLCDAAIPLTAPFLVHDVRFNQYGGCEVVAEYAGSTSFPGFPELRSGIRYVVDIDLVSAIHDSHL